jgi:hypothetical protein
VWRSPSRRAADATCCSLRQVQVAVVDDTVEISIGKELIRVHPVRNDRTREHGALANPGGRPRRINAT